jgi:hypothetical protein
MAAAITVSRFLTTIFILVGATAPKLLLSGNRKRPVALAAISSASDKKASIISQSASRDPLPSGWFGDFSEGESTYSKEGLDSHHENPEWAVKYGRDPALESPYRDTEVFEPHWFHESESGGKEAAWQTHWPSLRSTIAGNRGLGPGDNPWREEPEGWVQDYRPMLTEDTKEAAGPATGDWFDNSVRQIDGFGRKMQPGVNHGQRYPGWKERSVNTTIRCEKIGCNASSALQLFNADTEEAKDCSLAVHIHPTDYDDDWSRENVEFIKINNFIATRGCNPRARGCNSTAERPLYPCLNNFNVDRVIKSDGSLVIAAKNTQMVDECPVTDGDKKYLLSGVAMATCMVRNKPPLAAQTITTTMFTQEDLHGKAVLKCDKPGCKAETVVYFSPAIALNGGKCVMNMTVQQTDYDDALGPEEQLDFVQVEGTNMTTAKRTPGKNPCNMRYQGKNISDDKRSFTVLEGMDVTELVKKSKPLGALRVAAKISDHVDECGYKGNLLYGNIAVHCVPPAQYAATPPPGQMSLLHEPPKRKPDTKKHHHLSLLHEPPKQPVLLQRSAKQRPYK